MCAGALSMHSALRDHFAGEMGQSFSISQTSCSRAGPRGPAVWMLKLSVTGVPDAWARGGLLDLSFIRYSWCKAFGRGLLLDCEALRSRQCRRALRQRYSWFGNVVC